MQYTVRMEYNVYCDESCHLENDNQPIMVLGALWCPMGAIRTATNELRRIKARHNKSPKFETKWTKVSPAAIAYYHDLIEYFFSDPRLHFRALIASEKENLAHDEFQQSHDEWYYKMYFDMLKVILSPVDKYSIYLDIKDTRGAAKRNMLREVLCNNMYDFERNIIAKIQVVRSHESELMQLADLLIGVISYANRGLTGSAAKSALVEAVREKTGYSLTKSTLYGESKVNLFKWLPRSKE